MDNIIDKIKMIIKNKEPNKIISIECDFSDMSGCNDYNYYNLVIKKMKEGIQFFDSS